VYKIRVDDGLIKHICNLSMLELNDREFPEFREQLQKILDYMSMLEEVDTENVPPMFGGIECPPLMRMDIPFESLSRSQVLQNAPAEKEGLFEIPKVIE
jgi:aspartyl-tRNA(Asn)/glutamyl-tRNA(Gln) amidotransferase subunit C